MCVTSVRYPGAVTMKCRCGARIGERPRRRQHASHRAVVWDARARIDRELCRLDQCQSLILTSFGAGLPRPVSTSSLRLIRNVAHLVLQWCMNSTGSRHPRA